MEKIAWEAEAKTGLSTWPANLTTKKESKPKNEEPSWIENREKIFEKIRLVTENQKKRKKKNERQVLGIFLLTCKKKVNVSVVS